MNDGFGLCWQLVPRLPGEMMAEPDCFKARRAMGAMLRMVKRDTAALRGAFSAPAG